MDRDELMSRMSESVEFSNETMLEIVNISKKIVEDSLRDGEAFDLYDRSLALFDEVIDPMRKIREAKEQGDKQARGWLAESRDILTEAQAVDCEDEEFQTLYKSFVEQMNKVIVARNKLERNYSLQRAQSPYVAFRDVDYVKKLIDVKVDTITNMLTSLVFGLVSGNGFLVVLKTFFAGDFSVQTILFGVYMALVSSSIVLAGYCDFEKALSNVDLHRDVKKLYKRYKRIPNKK